MSFCLITGRARNLPKPNFFPIIPPISPADARKLCRITGKRMDTHNYVPLLEIGQRPECCKCSITGKHNVRIDYKYVTPILRKDLVEDGKAFEDLQKLLKRLKRGVKDDQLFVYMMPNVLCGLIVPAEVEEAIRLGEMETVSLSKTCDKVIFKIRGKPTVFVPLKEVDIKSTGSLLEGQGQSKETLAKQNKVLDEKKKRTLQNKKIFEDLERQADEELQRDLERPKGHGKAFTYKSKAAKEYRLAINHFRDLYLPECNMAAYGPQWKECILNAHVDKLDWARIDKVRQMDLDCPSGMPKKAALVTRDLPSMKRRKNVFIPDSNGLEIVPFLGEAIQASTNISEELTKYVEETILDDSFSNSWSLFSMFANGNEDSIKILPTLEEFNLAMSAKNLVRKGCIFDSGDGLKFAENPSSVPNDSNVVVGAIFKTKELTRFFPGHFFANGDFIPGQRMASVKGEFIPGASIKDEKGHFQFIPGCMTAEKFSAGQFINDGSSVSFVAGQVVHSKAGPKFVEGETIVTEDGLKFVAGIFLNDGTFFPGAVIDEGGEHSRFHPGILMTEQEDILFLPGEMAATVNDNGKPLFIPGQRVNGEFQPGQMIERSLFIYGEIIKGQFLPGIYDENEVFVPGLVCDVGKKGTLFVEGKLFRSNETLFIPGSMKSDQFQKSHNSDDMRSRKSPSPPPMAIDGEGLTVVYKKIKPKIGTMLIAPNGKTEFYPNSGPEIPSTPGGQLVPGRMEYKENGPTFVPGKVMEIHGIKTFIPGKMMKDELTGEDVFVPGKMVDGKNGGTFLPGQVIESEDGDEKFILGEILKQPDGSVKFVPGKMIETKSGAAVFIPGQVIRTDNGLKFVPGLIVETSHGALFVPAQVIDAPEGARFLPGHVVDTPEGPRLLPPDIKGEGVDLDYIVQGFDISPTEARLILGNENILDNSDVSDILGGIGGASIGSEALKALADGFESRNNNHIITFGEGEDVDQLLQDEMLDSCDTPAIRRMVKSSFMDVFADLCKRIDEIIAHMNAYIDEILNGRLNSTLMMSSMKLNPALEALRRYCEEKRSDDPEEFDILNLVAGIITCSIPGALKECCSEADMNEAKFKTILMSYIEDSIKGILEEDGTISNGLMADIRELVNLAKDLEFDENQSFFAKVEAVTEGRCNSKFMDTLLSNLRSSTVGNLGTSELLTRLINILAPRLHLQSGFKEMCSTSPEFVQEVLDSLKGRDPRDIEGFTAIDILHFAITKVINNRCQMHLDDVVHKVELDGLVLEKDQDLRSMLEQAIGLAKYMGKSDVVDSLFELIGDPIRLEAIRDDPVIKDVLNKILVMQKLTSKDARKRQKLEKLQRFQSSEENNSDDDDTSLRELIRICEALTRPPHRGTLKKSKSMVKKSKSMIMTAKDIPMNAFMAMKNSSDNKDEKWLQNFLSESLVEEIPWECSKALIILKEGYQAIIPREASRSILMGEASYTLIDDNGVEFYLSPKDKLNRKRQGLDEPIKKITLLDEPIDLEEAAAKAKSSLVEAEPNGQNDEDFYGSASINGQAASVNGKGSLNGTTSSNGAYEESFDLDVDYKPYGTRRRNLPLLDDLDDEDATLASLDKYRPSAYEFGPPKDDSDINDIRDYYSGLLTKSRALNKYGLQHDMPEAPPTRYAAQQPKQDFYQDEDLFPQPRYAQHQPDNVQAPPQLDETSRFILDKAKSVRTRSMWEPEVRQPPQQYQQPLSYNQAEESLMSSKTRSLLSKLKESTAQLQEYSSQVDDFEEDLLPRKQTRKTSRFLRNRGGQEEHQQQSLDVSRMADEILGESLYPPEYQQPMRQPSRTSLPSRKYSYQSSNEADRFSDRSSPEARMPLRSVGPKSNDDDELDTMINDLKMRTRGRDMSKIIHDIEGGDQRVYGRKSVSPIPRSRDFYEEQPIQPVRRASRPQFDPYDYMRSDSTQQQQQQQPYRRASSRSSFDPYDYMRSSSDSYSNGYSASQPQHHQPQQIPQRYGMTPQYQYGMQPQPNIPFGYPQRGMYPQPSSGYNQPNYYSQQGPPRGYYD